MPLQGSHRILNAVFFAKNDHVLARHAQPSTKHQNLTSILPVIILITSILPVSYQYLTSILAASLQYLSSLSPVSYQVPDCVHWFKVFSHYLCSQPLADYCGLWPINYYGLWLHLHGVWPRVCPRARTSGSARAKS
jgi:hypothetical protein